MKQLNKWLHTMGYKTSSGKWNWKEIRFDALVYTVLAVCIAIAIVYGGK